MKCFLRWLAAACLLPCYGITIASSSEPPWEAAPSEAGTLDHWGTVLANGWSRAFDLEAWQGPGHWRVAFVPYAPHFRPSDEHTNVWAIGLERQVDDDWLAGATLFRNSFGQPSAYAYIGHRSTGLADTPPLFFQWSAGLMYGYRGKYEDKVPLNVAGFAPGALIGLGWQFDKRISATVHLLGDAGLALQLAVDFP